MLKEAGIYKGINLGGWFSQCDYSKERLEGFITEADFRKIADWGFDHVRIPVDYNVILEEDGSPSEYGLGLIDQALDHCRKYGLRTVLDLHKTPGFSFDAGEGEAGFFESEKYQKQFYFIWEMLAARYGVFSDRVLFELLNEVTEESYLPAWMRISSECIRRIRVYAPDSFILLGSFHHNGAREVQYLDAPLDDRVLYNFHCYEPIEFTHQGAYWMDWLTEKRMAFEDAGVAEAFFEELLAPAIEKAKREGTDLYCGEYGVIDIVPPEEAVKWFRVIHAVFEKYGIARAAWSYKQMDFGISDPRMDGVREELLGLL